MDIKILNHARQRMQSYNISEAMIKDTINNPDSEIDTYGGRRIAQKKLGTHLLRVIYERQNQDKTVVTVYKARPERYEI